MSYDEFLHDKPSDGALELVSSLASQQDAAQAEVFLLEAQLKGARERLRQIAEDRLPTAMADCHVKTFTTHSGLSVRVDEKFRAGQLDDKTSDDEKRRPLTERLRALEYLEDEGHGDLMRRTIQVTLDKDSEELAAELTALLRSHRGANKIKVEEFRVVPWTTLSSFAKSQLREGYDPDLELLGVSRVTIAKVVRPKHTDTDDKPF